MRNGCQCPLGLVPHFYVATWPEEQVTAVHGCQCPLGLVPHFYYDKVAYGSTSRIVSMPSRAVTSFLQYPFKNLGFMRFPEPVFAGIYQNILTITAFRAC